ncbi:MAG: hypothetical protein ACRDTT_36060, partial [Pseudonocardiaceae bacterium]
DVDGLRQDVTEQGQAIVSLQQEVAGQGRAIVSLDQRVTGLDQRMTEGFETLNTGMADIKALLTGKPGSEQD